MWSKGSSMGSKGSSHGHEQWHCRDGTVTTCCRTIRERAAPDHGCRTCVESCLSSCVPELAAAESASSPPLFCAGALLPS